MARCRGPARGGWGARCRSPGGAPIPADARLAALLLAAGVALAAPAIAEPETVEEIAACMRANLPQHSSVQELRLVTADRAGGGSDLRATATWRREEDGLSRVLVRVEEPEDLRGSAVLLVQRDDGGADLFSYLPELKKTRRLQSRSLRGSLFGSDFTYEDFQQLHGMVGTGTTERRPDAEVEGSPAWVLSREPTPDSGSAYARVVTFVDRATCLLRRVEMWEPGERLRKVLTVDLADVHEEGGVRLPRRVVLEDQRRGTATRLELLRVDLQRRVRRGDVSQSALER